MRRTPTSRGTTTDDVAGASLSRFPSSALWPGWEGTGAAPGPVRKPGPGTSRTRSWTSRCRTATPPATATTGKGRTTCWTTTSPTPSLLPRPPCRPRLPSPRPTCRRPTTPPPPSPPAVRPRRTMTGPLQPRLALKPHPPPGKRRPSPWQTQQTQAQPSSDPTSWSDVSFGCNSESRRSVTALWWWWGRGEKGGGGLTGACREVRLCCGALGCTSDLWNSCCSPLVVG